MTDFKKYYNKAILIISKNDDVSKLFIKMIKSYVTKLERENEDLKTHLSNMDAYYQQKVD